jgi:hypothetical protein
MPKKIKVTIDRTRWRTGDLSTNRTGEGYTQLLNQEGYMCCLGFCLKASKVAKKYLAFSNTPMRAVRAAQLKGEVKNANLFRSQGVQALVDSTDIVANTDLTSKAIRINDNALTTPKQKEKELLELFKDSVFEIKFTGRYPRKRKSNDCENQSND